MFLSLGTNKDYKVDEKSQPKKKIKKTNKQTKQTNKRVEEERVKHSITQGSMIIKHY